MQTIQMKRMLSSQRHLRRLCTSVKRSLKEINLEPVIGLEVHMQINSKSKLFSSAPVAYSGPTNKLVAPFDVALPGTLPSLNRRCVEAAVQTALALNCTEINNISRFDRKHYFYADMPAGFQITQQAYPIARNGYLDYFEVSDSKSEAERRSCRILQIQLEQDSGKSIHDDKKMVSLIDLNRAGVGLLEIIFAPDLKSGEEASSLLKELLALIKVIGVCSGRMDEGAVRVDANVSVHEPGTPLGTRTEVKNLNSIRAVSRAINYEINRQICSIQAGKKISNVTLSFDSVTNSTVLMRDKEVLEDYRFFPEPNIPALNLNKAGICVETLRARLPTLPRQLRRNLMDTYKIEAWQAVIIMREKGLHELFTQTMNYLPVELADLVFLRMTTQMMSYMTEKSIESFDKLISPKHCAELMKMLTDNQISICKFDEILREVIESGRSPQEVIEENNWQIVNDENLLGVLCEEAMRLYPKDVPRAQRGKERSLNSILRHIRLATQNRADMDLAKEVLLKKLQQPELSLREEIKAGR